MKSCRLFGVLASAAISFLAGCTYTGERPVPSPPTRKELGDDNRRLRANMSQDADADFYAACINVARDVQRHQILVYALVPGTSSNFNTNGFEVRVVCDKRLLSTYRGEASQVYARRHNGVVLSFAAAQYASGDRQLGLTLVRLLARVHPDYQWSQPGGPALTITEIRERLESDDRRIKSFLNEEMRRWAEQSAGYNP